MTEDKIYFTGFPAESGNNRGLSVATGKISVGSTEYVEIRDDADNLDNAKATKIKNDKTRYKFATQTTTASPRSLTFTDD